jgi:predicted ATPase
MIVHGRMTGHQRAARERDRRLRVVVADCHEPGMALAHDALASAGHATTGARDVAAALVLVDSADVLVVDPGTDEQLLRTLAGALDVDAALVVYNEHWEWLGRARHRIIVVPKGEIGALLDVVAGVGRRGRRRRRLYAA